MPLTPCRFADMGCPFPAVVIVEMDGGCVCFPDDREQALCAQHWNRSTPLGSFEEVEWAVAGSRLADG